MVWEMGYLLRKESSLLSHGNVLHSWCSDAQNRVSFHGAHALQEQICLQHSREVPMQTVHIFGREGSSVLYPLFTDPIATVSPKLGSIRITITTGSNPKANPPAMGTSQPHCCPFSTQEINPPPQQKTQTKARCAAHSLGAPSPLLPYLFIHTGRQANELFANEHPHLGAGTLAIARDRPRRDHHARRRWQSTAVHPNYHHAWGHMGWWRLTFAAQYFDAKWHLRHKLFCKSWLGSGWVFMRSVCGLFCRGALHGVTSDEKREGPSLRCCMHTIGLAKKQTAASRQTPQWRFPLFPCFFVWWDRAEALPSPSPSTEVGVAGLGTAAPDAIRHLGKLK